MDRQRRQSRNIPSQLSVRSGPPRIGPFCLPRWLYNLFPSTDKSSTDAGALLDFTLKAQKIRHATPLIRYILASLTTPPLDLAPAGIIFFINERTGVLQGIHGVVKPTGTPIVAGADVPSNEFDRKRQSAFCSAAMWLRIALTTGHPIVQAFSSRQIRIVDNASSDDDVAALLTDELGTGGYIAVPLTGIEKTFGVLVVAKGQSRDDRRRPTIEAFARQTELLIDNALELKRLEQTRQELLELEARSRQDEKLAMLGEVAASIAHDLKTPLVAIGGFARRLEEISVSSEARQHAEVIVRQTKRLEEILSGILTFSRKDLVCYAPCDLAAVVHEILQTEEEPLRQTGIEVATDIAANLPPIQGDALRISQVVSNLVVNARQAMPTGGRLTVRIGNGTLRGAPAVSIEVMDTGPGIPPEIAGSLFKPFFTTKSTGTGLGLAIAARIVEQHHGEIRAGNSPGGGATLRVVIPATQAANFSAPTANSP